MFSFNPGSYVLSLSMLFMDFYPLSMSVFSHIFFCFLLVKFRISCDLNFQLCSISNPYSPVGCFSGLQTQNCYFSCFHSSSSASLLSQHLTILPVTQPPEICRLSGLLPLSLYISSQILNFNHQFYS